MKIDPTLYTDGQFEELCRGKAAGIDYSLYANIEYNEYQMFELRMALTNGQDISDIAFTHYFSSCNLPLRKQHQELLQPLDQRK